MATSNKDFKIKNGLIVEGDSATVNGNDVLTTASVLDDLANVNAPTPNDGDNLVYDVDTQTWIPIAGLVGPTGPTGPTGPEGIVAQTEAPTNTDILWLDTDAEAAIITGPTGPTGPTGTELVFSNYSTVVGTFSFVSTPYTISTYTIPANPTTNTIYEFKTFGSFFNNNGNTKTVTFEVLLGSTVIATEEISYSSSSSTSRFFEFSTSLYISGTNTQRSVSHYHTSSVVLGQSPLANIALTTEDFSTSKALQLRILSITGSGTLNQVSVTRLGTNVKKIL